MSGFEVCAALKADPELAEVPVIFVTSHQHETFEIEGFDAGAADFIRKPVSPPLVLARVRTQLRMKRMADKLRSSATTDVLTGVANRRRFNDVLEREWSRARRSGDPLALILVDVDHFKLFNDRYGHVAGDSCLARVAGALAGACLRPADLVARYGGEEFTLLLPQTPSSGAHHVALRVLDAVAGLGIPHAGSSVSARVTVSGGVACVADVTRLVDAATELQGTRHPFCAENLVEAADRALYGAKNAGRAQIRLVDLAEMVTGGVCPVAPSQRITRTQPPAQ